MLRKLAIYVPLSIFAIITLVPFVYMACSALKPKEILFNSTFLPNDGLFKVDQGTGDLTLIDITHLPEGEAVSTKYAIEVVLLRGNDEVARKTVTVGYGEVDAADFDFVIPAEPEINQRLGRVDLVAEARRDPAAIAEAVKDAADVADPTGSAAVKLDEKENLDAPEDVDRQALAPADDPAAEEAGFNTRRYRIVDGNPRGALGQAWGLLTLNNFDRLFNGVPPDNAQSSIERKPTGVWRAIVNSFFYASVSSVLATLGAAMGGYGLAKFRFRGRGLIDNTVLAALVIPGALLIAPGYQLLYWFGMLDTYVGLILPGIAPAFGVYLFRQAMISSLPDEMIEAARIDGCGEVKMFFIMALPMVRPMAGAFLLITYLGRWNDFIGPQIILQAPEKYPLAVWISQLRGEYGVDYPLIMAGTLVAIAPVLVLFMLLQKEFIAGLTAGAVKG